MSVHLTEGALKQILSGNHVEKPILKILGHRLIEDQEKRRRCQLFVTDNIDYTSLAILDLNFMLIEILHKLKKSYIIQIINYSINLKNEEEKKYVMVIKEMNVIVPRNTDHSSGNVSDINSAPSTSALEISNKLLKEIPNEDLVDIVRSYAFIYNKRHKDYRNIAKKEAAWRGNCFSNPKDCLVRWTSIQDRYTSEMRNLGSPSGVDSSRKNPYFLDAFIKDRKTSSNVTNVKKIEEVTCDSIQSCKEEVRVLERTVSDILKNNDINTVEDTSNSVEIMETAHIVDSPNSNGQYSADTATKNGVTVTNILPFANPIAKGKKNKLKKHKKILYEIDAQLMSISKTLSASSSNSVDQTDPDYLLCLAIYADLKRIKPDRAKGYRKKLRMTLNKMEDESE